MEILESDKLGFEFWLLPHRQNYLISLNLGFPHHKTGMIIFHLSTKILGSKMCLNLYIAALAV